MRAASLAGYASLKQRILTTNMLLVALGSGVTASISRGDPEALAAFAAGGSVGECHAGMLV